MAVAREVEEAPGVGPRGRALTLADPTGYLNTAAEGLFLRPHLDAMRRYAEAKALGSRGRDTLQALQVETADRTARLLGAEPSAVTFLASTSRGLDIAMKSLTWRRGDNLVFADTEFPTIGFIATRLRAQGVEVRIVPSTAGTVETSDYVRSIDDRTRLVVASVVSYKSGQRCDLPALTAAAHRVGALVFADAIQALGAVDVEVGEVDLLCAGAFKWLAASHGVAVFYANPRTTADLEPPYVAYRGVADLFAADRLERFAWADRASRYDEGMPNFLGMATLHSSLGVLESLGGVPSVAQHNRVLTERLLAGLEQLGIAYLGPTEYEHRSSIVAFETPVEARVGRGLAERGIEVWARDGRVRLSPHYYNTTDDIDAVLAALEEMTVDGRTVAETQRQLSVGSRAVVTDPRVPT